MGWPSAIAPPLGLTRLGSAPSSASQASTTGAKASLISTASMSSIDRPVRLSACWVAGIGARQHHHRVGAAHRHVMDPGPWGQPEAIDRVLRCDEQGGGTVRDLAGDGGGEYPTFGERWQVWPSSPGTCWRAALRRPKSRRTGRSRVRSNRLRWRRARAGGSPRRSARCPRGSASIGWRSSRHRGTVRSPGLRSAPASRGSRSTDPCSRTARRRRRRSGSGNWLIFCTPPATMRSEVPLMTAWAAKCTAC